jgi:hypothetical protein
VIAAITAAMAWVAATVAAAWAATVGLVVAFVVAHITADTIARLLRVAIVIAITMVVINTVSIPATSLTSLWDSYLTQSSEVLSVIGYFVPISLMFNLLDLYLAAVMVLLGIRAVRYVTEAAQ